MVSVDPAGGHASKRGKRYTGLPWSSITSLFYGFGCDVLELTGIISGCGSRLVSSFVLGKQGGWAVGLPAYITGTGFFRVCRGGCSICWGLVVGLSMHFHTNWSWKLCSTVCAFHCFGGFGIMSSRMTAKVSWKIKWNNRMTTIALVMEVLKSREMHLLATVLE